MAQLLPNGEQVFLSSNGDPLASGTVDFYVVGTTTRKTTWQDAEESVANTNPVVLNASGRAVIFGSGAYRQIVKDSLGNTIWDRNVYSIDPDNTPTARIETFTGDNSTTTFTLGLNVGTDPTDIEVYVKTAAAIAGHGGFDRMRPTTDYTVSGTSLTFTVAPPTGADPGTGAAVVNIMVIWPDSAVGAAVSEAEAAETAAELAQANAEAAEGQALAAAVNASLSESEAAASQETTELSEAQALAAAAQAVEAADDATGARDALSFLSYTFDTDTTMADPGSGDLRLNNADLSLVTAAALSNTDRGGADVSDFVATWDTATHSPASTLVVRRNGSTSFFAVYGVTAVVDNGAWLQVTLSYVDHNGTLAGSEQLYLEDSASGSDGSGDVTGPGSSTDEALARFNGTTGKTIQNSNWTLTDAGILTAGGQERWVKGADLTSANPLVLGTDGNYFDVTGVTGFSSITCTAGTFFMLQFDGALTLTNGASLILPGAANITTAAGDRLIGFAEAANTVRVLAYEPVAGYATARIADNAVTLAKLATQAANTFLANGTAGAAVPTAIALAASQLAGRGSAGNITAITLGTGLSMSSDTLNASSGFTLAAEVATTAGTSVTIGSSIPAGVKQIDVMLEGVSLNGAAEIIVQIGDSGGVETSGYDNLRYSAIISGPSMLNITAGFGGALVNTTTETFSGVVSLHLKDAANFTWAAVGTIMNHDDDDINISTGVKSLSAELDRVVLTTVAGTATFDAGSASIKYI